MKKLQIFPPYRQKLKTTCQLLADESNHTTAWRVVHSVASSYRYHRSVVAETQRDLLRFSSCHGLPVFVGTLGEERAAFFYFELFVAERWLAEGGRTWIIAELEARGSRRVIAFPGRGGRS